MTGRHEARLLVPSLMFVALVVAAVGSLGTPLITSVATTYRVSLDSAQWTLTVALLSGAVATPVLGRLGAGPHRRAVILATLAVVVAGSALTVLPLPFAWLLAGRAAQGSGLGLTALMMGVARDHLPERRGAATIALISVVSIIGAGVGYPLAGLLAELGGVRAAYGLGLLVTAAALLTAWRAIPAAPAGRSARVGAASALLLAAGLFLVLFLAGETGLWTRHLAVAAGLAAAAVLLLAVWTTVELCSPAPLVDVRAVRHPAVAGANLAMFTGGIGMYLLLTLITRYAQTPREAGYGFGLTTFVAGLVLVPFSVLGFAAGKLTPRVRARIDGPWLLAGSAAVVGGGFVLFAAARSHLAELFAAMGVLGLGVGSFSAAMPGVILAVTPKSETSSAMSFNYVVRSVGYSLGSAVGGLVLAAGTGAGRLFPDDAAYTTAALVGLGAMAVTALTCAVLARGGRRALSDRTGSRGPRMEFPLTAARATVALALAEDAAADDVTTRWSIPPRQRATAVVVTRQSGVAAGMPLAAEVYARLGGGTRIDAAVPDGTRLAAGDVLARICGPAREIITGERTVLNLLQRLCGIATLTDRYAAAVRGLPVRVLDTRKTAPGLRLLDKYAVAAAGGHNHRLDLGALVLLKENHIAAAGGVTAAVESVRTNMASEGRTVDIEVEVATLAEAREALAAEPAWIMLDNMAVPQLAEAVRLRRELAPDSGIRLEASGTITVDGVRAVAETGVDAVSVGALTHSAPALDLSMLLRIAPS